MKDLYESQNPTKSLSEMVQETEEFAKWMSNSLDNNVAIDCRAQDRDMTFSVFTFYPDMFS